MNVFVLHPRSTGFRVVYEAESRESLERLRFRRSMRKAFR
jgi:hypothetical protein